MADKSPVKSWNDFVKVLLSARDKWETHKEIVRAYGAIDTLPIEAQRIMRYASIHKAADFERALLQLLNHWRVSGGLEVMLIDVKERKVPKNEESKSGSPPSDQVSTPSAA